MGTRSTNWNFNPPRKTKTLSEWPFVMQRMPSLAELHSLESRSWQMLVRTVETDRNWKLGHTTTLFFRTVHLLHQVRYVSPWTDTTGTVILSHISRSRKWPKGTQPSCSELTNFCCHGVAQLISTVFTDSSICLCSLHADSQKEMKLCLDALRVFGIHWYRQWIFVENSFFSEGGCRLRLSHIETGPVRMLSWGANRRTRFDLKEMQTAGHFRIIRHTKFDFYCRVKVHVEFTGNYLYWVNKSKYRHNQNWLITMSKVSLLFSKRIGVNSVAARSHLCSGCSQVKQVSASVFGWVIDLSHNTRDNRWLQPLIYVYKQSNHRRCHFLQSEDWDCKQLQCCEMTGQSCKRNEPSKTSFCVYLLMKPTCMSFCSNIFQGDLRPSHLRWNGERPTQITSASTESVWIQVCFLV